MKRQDNQKPGFQTHIAEPRWQQVISVIFVLLIVAGWLYLVFAHK